MTYSPKTIADLAAFWVAQGGVNLGIVGNTAHTSGYHVGKDRIYSSSGLGDRDYSIQLKRDKAGLSNAASALDIGKLNGSLTLMRKFSAWLVDQALAGKCPDVREIIFSTVDGVFVKRWSGPDNRVYTSLKRREDGIVTVTPGNGDASHYSHTHISFYRDSESRSKVGLFAPFFALPDSSTGEDPVKQFRVPERPTLVTVRKGAWLYDNPACATSSGNIQIDPGREFAYVGRWDDGIRLVGYEPPKDDDNESSLTYWVKDADVTASRAFTTDDGVSKADLDAAVAAQAAKDADAIAAAQQAATDAQTALAEAQASIDATVAAAVAPLKDRITRLGAAVRDLLAIANDPEV